MIPAALSGRAGDATAIARRYRVSRYATSGAISASFPLCRANTSAKERPRPWRMLSMIGPAAYRETRAERFATWRAVTGTPTMARAAAPSSCTTPAFPDSPASPT